MSTLWRWAGMLVAFAGLAAACSSDDSAMSVTEYADALQAVETAFLEQAPNPADNPEDRDQFAVGGDLTAASILYSEFEERLSGWRELRPPPELEESHSELVAALDAVQDEVGKYLAESATETTDFDFDTIGPKVGPLLFNARAACLELDTALDGVGASVDFAQNCRF